MKRLFKGKDKYCIENAERMASEVQRLETTSARPEVLVEILRELVEVLVWGDKHDEKVFDLFLERSIMGSYVRLATSPNTTNPVKVQIVQCVTIMLQNLTRQSSIFYLLSNNSINKIINYDFDLHDDEVLSNYVSFLKTLSLRLDHQTVQFFFLRDSGTFPLYTNAIKMFSHEDRMVRTSVRQVVFQVLQLTDKTIRTFATQQCAPLCKELMEGVAKQIERLSAELSKIDHARVGALPAAEWNGISSLGLVDTHIEDLIDDFYYVNDVAEVDIEELKCALRESFVTEVLPVLAGQGRRSVPQSASSIDNAKGGDAAEVLSASAGSDSGSRVGSSTAWRPPQVCYKPLALVVVAHWLDVSATNSVGAALMEAVGPGGVLDVCSGLAEEGLTNASGWLAVASGVFHSKLDHPLRTRLLSPQVGFTADDVPPVTPFRADDPQASVPREGSAEPIRPPDGVDRLPLPTIPAPDPQRPYPAEGGTGGTTPTAPPHHTLANALLHFVAHHVAAPERITLTVWHAALQLLQAILKVADAAAAAAAVGPFLAHCEDRCLRVLLTRVERYRADLHEMYTTGSDYSAALAAEDPSALGVLDTQIVIAQQRELMDPLECMYIRFERDFSHLDKILAMRWRKVGREVCMMLPLLPMSLFTPAKPSAGEDAVWRRYLANVHVSQRLAHNANEIEFVELLSYLLVRAAAAAIQNVDLSTADTDPIRKMLAEFAPHHTPGETVQANELIQRLGSPARCEYCPEPSTDIPHPAPGTVLYVFLDGYDLTLVGSHPDVPAKGSVAFTFQVYYLEAVVNGKLQFKLTLHYDSPFFHLRVPLAFRERSVCQQTAKMINNASRVARERACARLHSVLYVASDGAAPQKSSEEPSIEEAAGGATATAATRHVDPAASPDPEEQPVDTTN